MSDFDFDELDRAVAGVTGSDANQVVTDIEEPDTQRVVELKSTNLEPAPESNLESASGSAPESTPEPASDIPRNAPAARRSSGRFMDVVHPSSDMRTRSPSGTAGKAGSLSFVPPTLGAPSAATSASGDSIRQPQGHAHATAAEQTDEPAVGAWSKVVETPFLADAKVEKRPLGRPEPEPQETLLERPDEQLKLDEPDEPRLEAHTLPDPIDFAAHLASLDSEKEDTGLQRTADAATDTPADGDGPSITQLDELEEAEVHVPTAHEESEPSVDTTPEVTSTEDSEAPAGPASIQQQYTENPSAQPEPGAIYDTENYHQPLTPVAKKRSGIWTIIWILLLVVLGAGAGVAFYLYVLPML